MKIRQSDGKYWWGDNMLICDIMDSWIDVIERILLFYVLNNTTNVGEIEWSNECIRRYEDYWDNMMYSPKGYVKY